MQPSLWQTMHPLCHTKKARKPEIAMGKKTGISCFFQPRLSFFIFISGEKAEMSIIIVASIMR